MRHIPQVLVAGRVGELDAAIGFDDQQAFRHIVHDGAQALRLFLLRLGGEADLQLGAYPCAHFGHAQRLADVIDCAQFEAGYHVFLFIACAHEQHRDIFRGRVRFQVAARLEAVHAGHDDIEQDQVRVDAACDFEPALAGVGDVCLVTLLDHQLAQDREIVRRIINNQNHGVAPWRKAGTAFIHAD